MFSTTWFSVNLLYQASKCHPRLLRLESLIYLQQLKPTILEHDMGTLKIMQTIEVDCVLSQQSNKQSHVK